MTELIVGSIILLIVMAGLIAFTAWGTGWRAALVIWTAAGAVTAVVVAASYLVSAGMEKL